MQLRDLLQFIGWTYFGWLGPLGGNVKDPIALIDAILDAYDNAGFLPNPDGTTHCNQAVQAVLKTLGYGMMEGMTADQMVDFLQKSQEWSDVSIEKAQEMANQGSILIAGLSSTELNQGHGHVVVLRPGRAVYSGKWSTNQCPRVLNVGIENFIARGKKGPLTNQPCGLNESFQPLPHIWVLRSSL